MATVAPPKPEIMRTLPGDAVRQIQWRFADRYDLQMLVQSARGVARGPVARLVAAGERHSHDWTPAKNELLEAFDRAGRNAQSFARELGGNLLRRPLSVEAAHHANFGRSKAIILLRRKILHDVRLLPAVPLRDDRQIGSEARRGVHTLSGRPSQPLAQR